MCFLSLFFVGGGGGGLFGWRRGGGGKRKKEKSFGLEKCLKVQLSASILNFFPLFWKYFTQKLLKESLFAFEEFSSCFISYCLVTKMTYVYSGIIATVFGTTGFLGRYVVQQLGELFVSKLLILVDIMLFLVWTSDIRSC